MNWRYSMKTGYQKLEADPLDWKDGEKFENAVQRNGYRLSNFSGGDTCTCSFAFEVYNKEKEDGYLVCIDVNSQCRTIVVDDLPSLIELLSKVAPIAHAVHTQVEAELKKGDAKRG